MRPSFLALPRPAIACIFAEPSVADAVATIRNGEFDGADAFAMHVHHLGRVGLTGEAFARIVSSTKKPVMMLLYRGDTVQPTPLDDHERAEVLALAVEAGAAAVDITGDMFDASPLEFSENPAAIAAQMRFIERIHRMGAEVVLSSHIAQPRTVEQVLCHMQALEERGADYVKIVTQADTDTEFAQAVETTLALRRTLMTPFIHLLTGEFARPHRFLAPTLGCALTFCVQRYTRLFTTMQPPVHAMKQVLENYRWHIDDVSQRREG